jgi:glycosyltransferase involved in cell wall biosynthesis
MAALPPRPRVAVICQVMAHYRESVHVELDKNGDIDFVFASDPDGSHYALKTMSPHVLREHIGLKNRYWGRAMWQSGVLRIVLSKSYDSYVFTGDVSVFSTWLGALIARVRRKPVLFWTIGWHRPERGTKSLLRLTFYRLASRLMVYGNTAKRLGTSAGYPADRISVIYNSIGQTTQPTTGAASSHPVANVGAIARLKSAKRFDLLLRAVSDLNRAGTPVRVTLGGEGPEHDVLHDLAEELGVDLTLTGAVYGVDDTKRFYDSLDVTVIPTYAGLSIIQSLSHGVPVITDDDIYGQGPEWEAVTKETGRIFEHDDVASLTNALAVVLESVNTDRSAFAAACVAEVQERWTASSQAGRILEAIRIESARETANTRGTR